jgi:putative transcriptional regulator
VSTNRKLPLNDEELATFEATRDLGAELLQAGNEMKAGLGRVVHSPLIAARQNTGLTQQQFAGLLGISAEALEVLEQERTQPDGAVRTLIAIALHHPEALVAVAERTLEV